MGYISERKRNRHIKSAMIECRSVGISDEQFKAHKVTDEVEVILIREAYYNQ